MERNFTNGDFEDFLRQNSDELRMRPSDKVWKGVSKNLNRKKRRLGFGLMFGLLLTGGLGYLLLPSDPKRAAGPVAGSVPHGGNASPSVSETPVIDITAASRRQAPTESNLTSPASLSMTGRAAILPLHPLPENTTTAPVAESSSGQSEEAGVQAAADSSGAIPADAVPSNTFKPTVVDSHSEEILTQAGSLQR